MLYLKSNYVLILFLCLFFCACQKQEPIQLDENVAIEGESKLSITNREDITADTLLENYIHFYNGLSKKMYDAKVSLDTLISLQTVLSSPTLTETQNNLIFSTYFNITETEINQQNSMINELLTKYDEDELESLLNQRVDELYNSNQLDISYYDDYYTNLHDPNQLSFRIPCWKVALMGIGGGALAVAGGATHGNGFAIAWGALMFVDAVHTMASGGCD